MKNLRSMKVLLRGSQMTDKVKQQIAHEEKNLIHLDSDDEDSQSVLGTSQEIELDQEETNNARNNNGFVMVNVGTRF